MFRILAVAMVTAVALQPITNPTGIKFDCQVIGIIIPALIPEFVHDSNALNGPVQVSFVKIQPAPVVEIFAAIQ